MNPLLATIVKELRLLRRDLHGLALLFILPLAFILIMSLALQDLFASRAGHLADVLLIDRDGTPKSKMLQETLAKNEAFGIKGQAAPADLKQTLKDGRYAFAIEIRKGYGASLEGQPDPKAPTLLAVTVAPDTDKRTALRAATLLLKIMAPARRDLLPPIASARENQLALDEIVEGARCACNIPEEDEEHDTEQEESEELDAADDDAGG